MLILMRRPGESIHIGPNIVITLVSMERNRARIGIQAPREITVDREEIAEKKRHGQEAARRKCDDSKDPQPAADRAPPGNEREPDDEEDDPPGKRRE